MPVAPAAPQQQNVMDLLDMGGPSEPQAAGNIDLLGDVFGSAAPAQPVAQANPVGNAFGLPTSAPAKPYNA